MSSKESLEWVPIPGKVYHEKCDITAEGIIGHYFKVETYNVKYKEDAENVVKRLIKSKAKNFDCRTVSPNKYKYIYTNGELRPLYLRELSRYIELFLSGKSFVEYNGSISEDYKTALRRYSIALSLLYKPFKEKIPFRLIIQSDDHKGEKEDTYASRFYTTENHYVLGIKIPFTAYYEELTQLKVAVFDLSDVLRKIFGDRATPILILMNVFGTDYISIRIGIPTKSLLQAVLSGQKPLSDLFVNSIAPWSVFVEEQNFDFTV